MNGAAEHEWNTAYFKLEDRSILAQGGGACPDALSCRDRLRELRDQVLEVRVHEVLGTQPEDLVATVAEHLAGCRVRFDNAGAVQGIDGDRVTDVLEDDAILIVTMAELVGHGYSAASVTMPRWAA
jgi:hypothetical protein